MKILVVGPGAMGTLFAGLLASSGHEVWVLGRRAGVVRALSEGGATIVRGEESRVAPVMATLNASEAGKADLVVIFVKAYSTLQATRDALPAVGDDTVVLTLQNGLNNVETIASVVGRDRVIAGVTAHGATLLKPGTTRHAGEGDTAIGELDGRESERLLRVAATLGESGVRVEISHDVDSLVWGKLIVNAAINPLTAVLRVRNGKLLERKGSHVLLSAAAQEAAAVARAKGVALAYDDPVEHVERVCRRTASNRSSMLQDIDRGVQTEVDYINGAVVREGEAQGVPAPVNWTLWQLVKVIEKQKR